MDPFPSFRRDAAFDAASILGGADAQHEVVELAAGLPIAPARPVDDLRAVELVEFDLDAVRTERLRESQHSRSVLERIVAVADEGRNPAHCSRDYIATAFALESMTKTRQTERLPEFRPEPSVIYSS